MYQLTETQYQGIAATFASVFPDCQLFLNHFRGDTPVLGLVGWKNPADSTRWRETVARRIPSLRDSGEILDPVLRHPESFELLSLGPWKSPATGISPVIRLDDPALEFSAARERLTGNPGKKYFYMNRWFQFCLGLRERNQVDGGSIRLATSLQTLESASAARHPAAREILGFLRANLPGNLLSDKEADWSRWPGSVLPN